jgi:hypothetical protein
MSFITCSRNDHQRTPVLINCREIVRAEPIYREGYVAIHLTGGAVERVVDDFGDLTRRVLAAQEGKAT